jgi:hypothetical protein
MRGVLALLFLWLTGCAQYGLVSRVVAEEGARTADETLRSAKFVQCRGITIGAWWREYGANATKANAWRIMCGFDETTALPADK